jgi:hypothetical protein
MQKSAIALLMAVSLSTYGQKCHAEDLQNIISGRQIPLTLQLKQLDNSWRQIAISGQYEMGDLMKSWSSLFGAAGYNNNYYTQGQTVKINDETYVVAYRLPGSGKAVNFQSLFENALGSFSGSGCSSTASSDKITPETSIGLSLLNTKTIGSLNDVRPFNLKEELAALEKIRQEAEAACEKTKAASMNSQVETNLRALHTALQSYADSNNGKLPNTSNPDALKTALKDYVTDESVFVNPETMQAFTPNPSLSGKKLGDITNPDRVVAFYEAKPATDGTTGVIFVDGFYQRMTSEDWQKLKQESKLP